MDHTRSNDLLYGHYQYSGWPLDAFGDVVITPLAGCADADQPASDAGENSLAELDRRLDLALEETFPASDPVSVICG